MTCALRAPARSVVRWPRRFHHRGSAGDGERVRLGLAARDRALSRQPAGSRLHERLSSVEAVSESLDDPVTARCDSRRSRTSKRCTFVARPTRTLPRHAARPAHSRTEDRSHTAQRRRHRRLDTQLSARRQRLLRAPGRSAFGALEGLRHRRRHPARQISLSQARCSTSRR